MSTTDEAKTRLLDRLTPEYGLFAVSGVLLIIGIARAYSSNGAADCKVFLNAGARFIEGTALYRDSDGHMPFKYAPSIAAFFAPYALLPTRLGCIAWNITSVLVFAAAGGIWLRLFQVARVHDVPLATVALAIPFYFELHFGQSDLLMLGLATVSYAYAVQDKPAPAGVCFALLVLVKPPTLLVGLPLMLYGKRRGAVVVSSIMSLFALALIVIIRYGGRDAFNLYTSWRDTLATTTPPWALGHNSQGLLALVHQLLRLPEPTTMADLLLPQAVATVICCVPLLAMRNRPSELAASCLLASALLSPLAWRANFVLAWPAMLSLCTKRGTVGNMIMGAILSVQILLANGVLPPAMADVVWLTRPYAWLFLAVVVYLAAAPRWISARA